MKIVVVIGARPNFVKLAALASHLGAWSHLTVVHTGQHYDDAMSGAFFTDLQLRPPDVDLGVGSGTHSDQTARVMLALEPVLTRAAPDLVIVVGDVNSTLAGALVAAKLGLTTAHVEAGLRCGDRSMPEEINRVVVDHVADLLFAPSTDAVHNLEAEGIHPDAVHLVGNVMIDTLVAALPRARERAGAVRARLGVTGAFALLTLHRPETVDNPATFADVLGAMTELSAELPMVFPVHPRTAQHARELADLGPGLLVSDPLGYLDFVALEAEAAVVITDSGGVQEETSYLGVPCVTVRPSTERPVTCELGTNRIAGHERGRVVAAAREALAAPRTPAEIPLWDGRAAERISAVLRHELEHVAT